MNFRLFAVLCFCITYNLVALSQVYDDFSDGDLTNNPTWFGDIANFIVNENLELQLNASVAGFSELYIPISLQSEQIWEIDLTMDFAPSSDNRLEVYFHLDALDIETANGYFFKIGETGSNDALVFYRLDNGISTEIARGIDGSLGSAPAKVNIQIFKNQSFFEIHTNYLGAGCNEQELMFTDDNYSYEEALYFKLNCRYTSTRVDKFFFDNISIYSPSADSVGPIAEQANLINSNEIEIIFDEPLELLSATDSGNYKINDLAISVQHINLTGPCMDRVQIKLATPIASGVNNILSISGIYDQNGNELADTQYFEMILLEEPEVGDLIISEILFNPYPGGSDFVEIFNNSDKYLLLTNLIIENVSKDESKSILEKLVLNPKTYLALSEDPSHLWQQYSPSVSANIFEQDIPSFNDASGNVSLTYGGLLLDSFDYSENLHFALIKDPEGVSLEKLDLNRSSNEISNWHSASSLVHYATPGYQNSQAEQFSNQESVLQLKNRIFSPDQDGFEDLLFLEFHLEKTGYLTTIKIFDSRGFPVRTLSNNELISPDGIIKWDGLNDEGKKVSIGSFIVHVRLFHPEGRQQIIKKTCVVSASFN